jgi:hypothetical protein
MGSYRGSGRGMGGYWSIDHGLVPTCGGDAVMAPTAAPIRLRLMVCWPVRQLLDRITGQCCVDHVRADVVVVCCA